jgi:hypothetical protein
MRVALLLATLMILGSGCASIKWCNCAMQTPRSTPPSSSIPTATL